jgi:hypothetical protein
MRSLMEDAMNEIARLTGALAASESARDEAVRKAEERLDCRRGPGWFSEDPACGACSTCLNRALDASEAARKAAEEALARHNGLHACPDERDRVIAAQARELDALRTGVLSLDSESAALRAERDEITARTLHLAHGFRNVGTKIYDKAAELLESFCAFPAAGEPVISIVAKDRDRAVAEGVALRAALQRAEEMIEAGVQAQMREHEAADLERAKRRAIEAMTVARLGGMVEGAPTHSGNFLQRVDALREIEASVQRKDEALRACRAGDGCLCSGGPYTVEGPQPHGHSARCRAWMRALGAETPADFLEALAAPDDGKGTKP